MIQKSNKKFNFKEMFVPAICSILFSGIFMFFFRIPIVSGSSMDNTLYDGQKLILSTKAYKNGNPLYGEIVVIKSKGLGDNYLVKRVIGTPGDSIKIKENVLYINGKEIEEDYLKEPMTTQNLELVIPEDKIFVMGDNRNHSTDSRNSSLVGLIDCGVDLYGKIIFDLSNFKPIK